MVSGSLSMSRFPREPSPLGRDISQEMYKGVFKGPQPKSIFTGLNMEPTGLRFAPWFLKQVLKSLVSFSRAASVGSLGGSSASDC